mgnify:CR=1 FL=1
MNREEKIMKRLQEHYDEALEHFPENRIVGIFLQGSQNYGLDYEGSDIDTKLIVVPSLEDIVLNKKPVSTTHVRANDEHIDFKDVDLLKKTVGDKCLVKAAGGVKSHEDFLKMIELGADRIGTSSGTKLINNEDTNFKSLFKMDINSILFIGQPI